MADKPLYTNLDAQAAYLLKNLPAPSDAGDATRKSYVDGLLAQKIDLAGPAGFLARNGSGSVSSRAFTGGTGISIANGDGAVANPSISLTGQVLAVHNLDSNGLIARTGAGTVAGRSIAAGTGITVTNSDGVSGNPTVAATLASQSQAEAGTDNTTLMTPLRTAQAIAALAGAGSVVVETFIASGNFSEDPDDVVYFVEVWGGGGSGAVAVRSGGSSAAGGGGGGAYASAWLLPSQISSPVTVTVGAGGAAKTASNNAGSSIGNSGGNSSFGSFLTAYGGGPGGAQNTLSVNGGGGGGLTSAGGVGSSYVPGLPTPWVETATADIRAIVGLGVYGGGAGAYFSWSTNGRDSVFGGGGGAGSVTTALTAGNSIYGGAGGGGATNAGVTSGGGTSVFGGAGGAGVNGGNAENGSVPGGGGGGATRNTNVSTTSGAGGRGEVRVWRFKV